MKKMTAKAMDAMHKKMVPPGNAPHSGAPKKKAKTAPKRQGPRRMA